jgi:peptide/nickel transport system permease protein
LTTAPTALADAPRPRRRLRPSSSFLGFVLRRAAALVLLAIGITLVVFVLTQLVPSNAVATNLGEQAAGDPAAVAAFKEHYGLDKPLPVRYWLYVKNLAQGDLGESSLTHNAVRRDLAEFIPATAELALYSVVIAAFFGIAFGVIAAMRRNRPTDHALRVVSLGGISMPTFWIALVALYVGFYKLGWFPGADRLDPGVTPPPTKTGLYSVDAFVQPGATESRRATRRSSVGCVSAPFPILARPRFCFVGCNALVARSVLVASISTPCPNASWSGCTPAC